jgi:hypothetical protein
MENLGGMILTGGTHSSPELSGNPTSSYLVAKQEELAKETNIFTSRSICLTYRKILHGVDGFTSPPKEDVLRNFIAL